MTIFPWWLRAYRDHLKLQSLTETSDSDLRTVATVGQVLWILSAPSSSMQAPCNGHLPICGMISKKVYQELIFVRRMLQYLPVSPATENRWTPDERDRFWAALDRYPRGPWTSIASYIGSKSTRQAMTHGQKLRQKLKRWMTRLQCNPNARSLMVDMPLPAAKPVRTEPSMATSSSSSGQGETIHLDRAAGSGLRTVETRHESESRCRLEAKTFQKENSKTRPKHAATSIAAPRFDESAGAVESRDNLPGYLGYLQELFEPQASTPLTAAGLSEAPYPTDETSMPARLLEELADVLFVDQSNEHS